MLDKYSNRRTLTRLEVHGKGHAPKNTCNRGLSIKETNFDQKSFLSILSNLCPKVSKKAPRRDKGNV